MTTLDHQKLITGDPSEMQKFRSLLLGGHPGVVQEVAVEHEADGSCCRRESWPRTRTRIAGAVKPPTPTVPVNLDRTADLAVLRSALEVDTR